MNYNGLAEKIYLSPFSIKKYFNILIYLFYSKKVIELISFIIWEAQYLLKLNSKEISFLNAHPLNYLNDINNIPHNSDFYNFSKCDESWLLLCRSNSGAILGCKYNEQNSLYEFSNGIASIKIAEFTHSIKNIFIDKYDNIFVCSGGIIYKSHDRGITFYNVLNLTTSESNFREEAITETPNGDIFIGEYANVREGKGWKFVGFIYHSKDKGDNWIKLDFLKKEGINKHIHILKWVNNIQGLILTEGDNKKGVWVNKSLKQFKTRTKSSKNGWKKTTKVHIQKGGYTGIIETKNKILLGTDYNGGTNFLVITENLRKKQSLVIPNPYRRSIFHRFVDRIDKNKNEEIWASLIFKESNKAKSLIMMSRDSGDTWTKVVEYDGTQFEIHFILTSPSIQKEQYISLIDKKNELATTFCISDNETAQK